jgi:hypothetical protein
MKKAFYILNQGDLQQDFPTLEQAQQARKDNKFNCWTPNSFIDVCVHHADYDPDTNSGAYHWEAAE